MTGQYLDNMPGSVVVSRRNLIRGGVGASLAMAASWPAAAVNASPLRQQGEPDTFTLVTNRVPSDLDPHSAYDAGSGVVLQGPFEGMIRLRPGTTDEYVPVLAESWSANEDNSVWTFRLRDGLTFHDGTPLDAEAARLSFERLLALDLAAANVLRRFLEPPAAISAPDSHTLVFDLQRPQPLFEAAIAAPFGTAIVNVAALRAHEVDGDWGHAWAQTESEGLGTGPYRVASFDISEGVVLDRFDEYWRGWEGDHFARIIIRVVTDQETRQLLVEQGDADLATTLALAAVPELEANPELTVDRRFSLNVRYLALGTYGPLRSPEARQALCWAFPYDEVVAGVYEDYAKRAIGPVAELCHGFDPATFQYMTDLDRARELLQDAGVPAGTTLVAYLPPGNQEFTSSLELFQANLAQIGITLEIQQVDFATYVGVFTGDLPDDERPNILPSFWSPDYNDAWIHLWPQLSCESWQSGNGGHYCNDRVEELLVEAKDAADEASYQAALSEIQQIVTRDDPAAVYMVQPQWLTVLRRDVGGFAPNPIVGEILDFYALYRTPGDAAGDDA